MDTTALRHTQYMPVRKPQKSQYSVAFQIESLNLQQQNSASVC
jgi:hypothetical protein